MKVWIYGFGDHAFTSKELAEQWKAIDDLLSDGENWGNTIAEVEVRDTLPKVTRKYGLHNTGAVYDLYDVEGNEYTHVTTFATYEEALAAAPAYREQWEKERVKRDTGYEEDRRKEQDEKYTRLKAAGAVS